MTYDIDLVRKVALDLGFHVSNTTLGVAELGVSSRDPKYYFLLIWSSKGVTLTGVDTVDDAREAVRIHDAIHEGLK